MSNKKLTQFTFTVDKKSNIKEQIPGFIKPFVAIVEPDGDTHKVRLPEGKYKCFLDDKGFIVKMTPGCLRITCQGFVNPETNLPEWCTPVRTALGYI